MRLLRKDTCGIRDAGYCGLSLDHSLVCHARTHVRCSELKRLSWTGDFEVLIRQV